MVVAGVAVLLPHNHLNTGEPKWPAVATFFTVVASWYGTKLTILPSMVESPTFCAVTVMAPSAVV